MKLLVDDFPRTTSQRYDQLCCRSSVLPGRSTARPGIPAHVTLPAGYVGVHVEYGYARTVDTAQGATVDHSLFAPSASATAERAYVALSRGRLSNRIYATHDRAWIDAISQRRGHALAVDQAPDTNVEVRQVIPLRSPDRDRQPPLEIGL